MKHTPGPWTVTPFRSFDKDIWINEPNVRVDHDDIDSEESEANANLIAAAPDLLEAVKELFGGLDTGVLVRNTVSDGEPSWALKMLGLAMTLKKCDTAIAKAEGRA